MFLTNKKGEKLFTVVISKSNEIEPYVNVYTWDEAINLLEKFNEELDGALWFRKIVKYDVNYGHRARLEFVENHKGWGSDYFVVITISSIFDK